MKNTSLIILLAFVFSFEAYAQVMMKKANENLTKSYPVDGTPLLQKQYKQVAEWIKAHPDYYNKMRMLKTSAWGFTVGSTHSWLAYNFVNDQYYSVPSTCRGIGNQCYVFVEDASWTAGKVNQAAVDSVINEFDNKTPANPNMGIYQTDTTTFGTPPDVDNDPRIIILILDIKDGYNGSGGYTAGYFDPTNEIPDASGTNKAEIYYMDCNPTDLTTPEGITTALQTCAHEFQHMINWNYHQTVSEWTFVNEGLSKIAEIICGYSLSDPELYAGETNYFLFGWRYNDATLVLNDYARAQRFFLYLDNQFGPGIFKYIVQDYTNHGVVGAGGLSYALQDVGQSLTLTQVFDNWLIANELNDKSVNPAWGYTYPGLPNSIPKMFYSPGISETDTIQNYAAEYLTFTNSKNLNITFSTSSKPVIKAIETGGTASPRVVDVPLNSAFSDASYGTTYNTISFVVIDTNLSGKTESTPLNNIVSYTATGTILSNVTELKWDSAEPIGYLQLTQGDSIAVEFDGVSGGKLDSIKVALRGVTTLNGNLYSYVGLSSQLGGEKLASLSAVPTLSQPPAVIDSNGTYPYTQPYPNWINIDLHSLNIDASNSFIVEFPIGAAYPATNRVMVTYYPSSGSYHSFSYASTNNPPGWLYYSVKNMPGNIFLYLIRAYVSFITTGVKKEVTLYPKEFSLAQNYPNPFNPSTTINFELPTAGRVRIVIYNQLGQQVAIAADENYSAGNHSINFNASSLASGIYFYRISAGSFVQTKKMVLLK